MRFGPASRCVRVQARGRGRHQLTFMCKDIHTTIRDLRSRGVEVKGEPHNKGYGITVMLAIPDGVEMMLYEPRHAMAIPSAAH